MGQYVGIMLWRILNCIDIIPKIIFATQLTSIEGLQAFLSQGGRRLRSAITILTAEQRHQLIYFAARLQIFREKVCGVDLTPHFP